MDLLQATRCVFTKPEYIACPGCGRTKYNLEETLQAVKSATSHLKGCTIAVMGCIVNGPGEMADADYGYVGEGGSKITLYKGKTPVMRGIPQEEAVQRLLELIASQQK
jgi:(E)-4-hydroxy-3-methylbut-2-enyl-diphosphate synthase